MNRRSGIESKQRIINAAMDVFSQSGYSNANIREIADKAGISVGGVYLYFRNKEELYRNLINDEMLDLGRKMEAVVEQAQSATEALSNFLKLYFAYGLKHKEFILYHVRDRGFALRTDEKRQSFRKKQRELVEGILTGGMRTREFRRHNVREMAKIILGSLKGIVLSMALDDEVIAGPEMLSEFVLRGLLRR